MSKLVWTSLMSEVAEPFCAALTAYLNQRLVQPQPVELRFIAARDYSQRRQLVMKGQVDMAWICGVDYVMNAGRPDGSYQPFVALCMNDSPKPVYYSDMIVRDDSAFRSFGDLRGAAWGYNEEGSWSGYQIMRAHLAQIGEAGPYFRDKIASGSHRNSIEMVRDGRVDTAAIDSTVIVMGEVTEPSLMSDLRVVERIGPYPMPPLILSQSCPSNLRNQLANILTTMHQTRDGQALLDRWHISRFDTVADSDYDAIRASLCKV